LPLRLLGCLQVEVMRPVQIDMAEEDRGKMIQTTLLHSICRRAQAIKCSRYISGILDGNHVEQQAQAGGAIELIGEISVGQYLELPIGGITCQAMNRLSLSKLSK
jgi:hypothetical protein